MEVYSFGNCITECCTPVMGEATSVIDGTDNIITVNFTACEPASLFRMFYRPQGSILAYRSGGTVTDSPFIVTDSLDTPGTEYEGYIRSECGELLGTPVAFVTSGYGCGEFFSGNYAPLDYHMYDPPYFLITTNEDVILHYDSFDRPNKFTVYDIVTGLSVAGSGWVGIADYPGPWGLSLFVPSIGMLPFTAVTGHSYKVVVEGGGADPLDPLEDSWEISIECD